MDKYIIKQQKPSTSTAACDSEILISSQLSSYSASSSTSTSKTKVFVIQSVDDISKIGGNIVQIKCDQYPKDKYKRSFQADWFNKYKWLEYSLSMNAIFCYPCRQFQAHQSKENAFISTGFSNWKTALCKNKGIPRHETSKVHIAAMSMWCDKQNRINLNKEVCTVLNNDVLERHRYYVKSVAEVIQFLAVNELASRGTYDITTEEENSLFNNLFKYTMQKDSKLAECAKLIPANATYLSPQIQNDIIEIMAKMVRLDIVQDVKAADIPWYTILEDGTRDKNNRENIAIGVGYIKNGKAHESILGIKSVEKLDAETFANLTLDFLQECGLDHFNILSQCYDGASVMSGHKGGVQALIQKKLNREIPYIHCSNHRLHLVIIKAINDIPIATQFFEQCSMLYNFLKRGSISNFYKGQPLARLLEQRWSGHLCVTQIINNNYAKIIEALAFIKNNKQIKGEYIVESIGLLKVMKKPEFLFCMIIFKIILEILHPADKILQARESSLKDAMVIITAVISQIEKIRTSEEYEKIKNLMKEFSNNENIDEERAQRQRKRSKNIDGFLIMHHINEEDDQDKLRPLFFEILDIILIELKRRFSQNSDILDAVINAEDLNFQKSECLQKLGIKIPQKHEIMVVKSYLEKSNEEGDTFSKLYNQRVAFNDTYNYLAACRTFACSTALCESTFSVLTKINRSQRMSMTHQRMANLIFLAFEKKKTTNINMNSFLREFHNAKERRLQLF